ncbi:hypothetical protein Goari_001464, partial [Gossypium aridum]|nr:hypothetical protein [Gossypium aridum]
MTVWFAVTPFPRISYSPITLIARNRYYAPLAPITYSVFFPFCYFIFCPRPQHSYSLAPPCTGHFFSLPLTLSLIIVHRFFDFIHFIKKEKSISRGIFT